MLSFNLITFILFYKHKQISAYGNKSQLIHGGKNQIHCDFDHRPVGDQTCTVDTSNWNECSVENGFGYARSAPCIILKLNRVK